MITLHNGCKRCSKKKTHHSGSYGHSLQMVFLADYCANRVKTPAPGNGVPIYVFFGQAGNADPLDGCH